MAIGDAFTQITDGGNPIVTTVTSARSPAGASLSCDDLSQWPNDTVHFITYEKDSNGLIDKTTQQDFKGIVSGNTIGTVTLKHSPTGSDLGNAIGDFVQMAPTASYGQDLYDGATHEHDVDGNHASNMITDRTADATPASDDLILTSDTSASAALKKVTIANAKKVTVADSVKQGDLDTGAGGIGAAWASFTPTISGSGSAVGNGTLTGYYTQVGKTVKARIEFTLDSTSTMGTVFTFALPVAAQTTGGTITKHNIGNAYCSDATGSDYDGLIRLETSTTGRLLIKRADGTYLTVASPSSGAPFTWTTSDVISATIQYEGA